MRNSLRIFWLTLLSLVSCVRQDGVTQAFGQDPGTPTFTGPQQGTDVVPGGNLMDRNPEGFTAEEDIVFTDPDNPDAHLPKLSEVLTDPKLRRGPWERDIRVARKESIREGKPLLIWFTDLRRSPRCKQLQEELFNKPVFQAWANDNLIRMRVNESEDLDEDHLSLDQVQTMRVEFAKYVKRLKKNYKVLGYPSLVMLDSQGRVIGHYRGYKKGQADLTWGRLRQGVVAANASNLTWRKQLTSRGYREWKDLQGRKVLAKLTRYINGTLQLVEPDGTRSEVHERTLCAADRLWIEEQKSKQR